MDLLSLCLSVLCTGVGSGTLLAAYIFSHYGGSVAFLSFGVAALIVAVLYWSVSTLAERLTARGGWIARHTVRFLCRPVLSCIPYTITSITNV